MINYRKQSDTNVWLGSKPQQQGSGLGGRMANLLQSKKPVVKPIVSQKTLDEIEKKKMTVSAYKKTCARTEVEKLGHNLEPAYLRKFNPFSHQYCNLTVQGYLTAYENELANELRSAI
jgi:predicted nucleic acid-binding protein